MTSPVVERRRDSLLGAGFRFELAERLAHPRPARRPSVAGVTEAVSVPRAAVHEVSATHHDAESRAWIDALTADGHRRDEAIERLHALLLRAARFEISRRRQVPDLDDLATQAAAEALMAVMRKLHTFRGDSRFTTWAYKFALFEAGVKVRRRTWQEREVPLEDEGWARLADRRAAPDADAETAELLGAVQRAIAEALTPHQRSVLVAITLNDVPIDVLAERLSTTRGALYKTLHDGRKKLRARLADEGYDAEGVTP
jgi:RNA polymerase sigma-70 factor (ECF subfamily)